MKRFDEYSTQEQIELLEELHNNQKISLREIARQYKTYAVKLSRFCAKHNIPTLSKSEALQSGYDSKRITPAMLGKQRSEEEKILISERQHEFWKSMSEDERSRRSALQSEIFARREDKESFHKKGCRAIRRAADEGSKLEKAVKQFFDENNIEYYHHYTGLFGGTQLEADFYLPEYSIVLEVDGPSHFSADFGVDKYADQLRADEKKNGLVLSMGMSIIRVRHSTMLYKRDYRKVFNFLKTVIPTLDNELRIVDVAEL